jgi:hypothetical protein
MLFFGVSWIINLVYTFFDGPVYYFLTYKSAKSFMYILGASLAIVFVHQMFKKIATKFRHKDIDSKNS